jgi:hypothetical protein
VRGAAGYIWRNERSPVFLITVFQKNEKENLLLPERNALKNVPILRADRDRRDILKLSETRWLRYLGSAHRQVRLLRS